MKIVGLLLLVTALIAVAWACVVAPAVLQLLWFLLWVVICATVVLGAYWWFARLIGNGFRRGWRDADRL